MSNVPLAVVEQARKLARKVFAQRGNHSEAHISEPELTGMFVVAILKGVELLVKSDNRTIKESVDA